MSQVKHCSKCKLSKPLADYNKNTNMSDGYANWCKKCLKDWSQTPEALKKRALRAKTPAARNKRKNWLKKYLSTEKGKWTYYEGYIRYTYGLTLLDLATMYLSQWWRCCGCTRRLNGVLRGRYRSDHIDHDHNTGVVRGILCTNCNTALGKVKDDVVILHNLVKYITTERTLKFIGSKNTS